MNRTTDRACYMILFALGVSVLVGWHYNITALKSVREGWVTMKTFTATCFILTSYIFFMIRENGLWPDHKADLWLECRRASVATASLFMLMGMLVMGFGAGMEMPPVISFLFVEEGPLETGKLPGVPSIMTMIGFSVISVFSFLYHPGVSTGIREAARIVVLLIGLSGALGYILDWPILYGRWNGAGAGAMALHTALGLIVASVFGYRRHGTKKLQG